MQQKINRPVRSTASQVIATVAVSVLVWGDLSFGFAVKEDLAVGRILSPTVVFGLSKYYYQSSSPIMYRAIEGMYVMGFVVIFIAALLGMREVIFEHKRKVSAQKKDNSP